jgi:prepilin-type N-terminal cleavage/methylation domain-containing protein
MKKNGFTLVELMIAIAIGMVVMLAIYSASNLAQRSSSSVGRKVVTQQDARAVLDLMAMEIRMASFNPRRLTGIWRDPASANCGALSANQNYKGIQTATANAITVEMDINPPPLAPSVVSGDGIIANGPNNHDNEVIRYSYDGASSLCRSTNCGGCQTILGGVSPTGVPLGTNVVNNAAGIPLFRYYDRLDNIILAAGLPAQIPNIRRINITLVVDNDVTDPGAAAPRRMIYSTNVIVRNHVLSP